jgi:hypothetical protein
MAGKVRAAASKVRGSTRALLVGSAEDSTKDRAKIRLSEGKTPPMAKGETDPVLRLLAGRGPWVRSVPAAVVGNAGRAALGQR